MESPAALSELEEEERFRRSGVPADPHTLSDLAPLRRRMQDIGFEELQVARMLDLSDLTYRNFHHIPAYRRMLRGQGKLATAIEFWLLQLGVPLPDLRACIGDSAISALDRLGWLALGDDGVRCRVELYPCAGSYFFSDAFFKVMGSWPDQVYWLGGDSYQLAYAVPRRPLGQSLDICTGSGIHAILSSYHSQASLGFDINPRAIAFSKLNAAFNGRDNCQFVLSDGYQEAGQRVFDRITINPPFVPCPENIGELYRAGGGTGESVTEKVVRGLPQYLAPGGLFAMTTEAAETRTSTPLERLRSWLGPGWGLSALYFNRFPLNDYVLPHALASVEFRPQDGAAEFERWLEAYEAHQITAMVQGIFYAVRLQDGQVDWQHERWMRRPHQDMTATVEDWLRSLQSWHSPLPGDVRPRIHPQVKTIYQAESGAVVEFAGEQWCATPLRVGATEAAVLRSLTAGQSLAQMLAEVPQAEQALRNLAADLIVAPQG